MPIDGLHDRLAPLPRERAQALPALHLLHDLAGYLPPDGLEQIGRWLHIPNSDLYAVATSYTEFRSHPAEPDVVGVCRGLSCRLAGSDALLAGLRTAGRRVKERECLFACAVAPVIDDSAAVQPLRGHASVAPPAPSSPAPAPPDPSPTPARTPTPEIARPRLNLHAGSMAHALGAAAVLDTLRHALPDLDIVETGGDGAAWAGPVLALPHQGPSRPAALPVTAATAVDAARALLSHSTEDAGLAAFFDAQPRRLLARAGQIDPTSFDEARAAGAYVGLKNALSIIPEAIVDLVEASGLRGRGGAYFPVHLKWRSAIDAVARNGTPILVINAEEGEPGVFKDRGLMEADPHRLVEGIAIAARAIGADTAYLYINGQAALSAERMDIALGQAEQSGITGPSANLDIHIRRGAGGYVCGEETVILESIEGRRAVPRLRPPFPTESGLWGRPTVINNVETLCNLPDLLRFGVDWFRQLGTDDAPGTKLISLSGTLPRPGLIEVPMGATVADILGIGGLPTAASTLTGVVAGGPSGGLLPPHRFDVAIGPGLIDEAGAVLGSGGFVAFDGTLPLAEIVQVEADYNARESCGKCTPCREGGERLADALRRLRAGDASVRVAARHDIDELIPLLRDASLCGLGQMAPAPVTSALAHFESALIAQQKAPIPETSA
ncbi:MAG: NADH:ubiquinone oxidoreductase [Chloroflexi bacterium]|nr:MAG: NADH:ubiquinone oxidoreductase [Chloroflexota bacterium]